MVELKNCLPGAERGSCFSRLQSAIFCSMKSLIASGTSGPRFYLGAVWSALLHPMQDLAILGVLVYVIGALPVCKEGIQGDGEGSDVSVLGLRSLLASSHL